MLEANQLNAVYSPGNFSWIVENELAGMGWPQRKENLEFLKSRGIKHLITLSPEMIPPIENFQGIKSYKIYIEEFEAPTIEQIQEFIDICSECRNKNEAVGVHCRMGRGRTGVMGACYLIYFQDVSPQRAVIKIRLLRPGSVETTEQERVVSLYHDYIRAIRLPFLLVTYMELCGVHWLPAIAANRTTNLECPCEKDERHIETECRCTGPEFIDIPRNLPPTLTSLIVEDAGIEVLKRDSLLPYALRLQELTLVNLEKFYYFEAEVFAELKELHSIYIQRAPKLLKIQADVFNINLPKLKILRIVNTGLEEIPNLSNLNTETLLYMIDLEHNNIKKIQTKQASGIKADQVLLNYNELEVVEEEAFYGSQIAKLSLKGNKKLQHLHRKAFAGLQSLRDIDLSNTAITMLPTEGLREIDILKIQDTETLHVFPSVFNFQFIKEAWLTYPYHCCAFKFPHTHNPWEFERHYSFIKQREETCVSKNASKSFFDNNEITAKPIFSWPTINNNFSSHNFIEESFWNEEEIFHNDTLNLNTVITTAVCGKLYINYHEVKCYPAPDAFNPCEDLMGNWSLRVPVWFISFAAVIGNLFVIIVISTSHFRLTVSKFLMCNLAVADFCIGVHLLILALVDTFSIGVYFNYAIGWQEANGCKVAGSLTIFGNILSVYTLTVITTERWYTITWAIHLNRRLKLRTAVRVMLCGWICAIFMASLPLFGVSSYSKTSICLPLENKEKTDVIYLSTLLIFNAFAFVIICVCYGSMYKSIKQGGNKFSTTSVRSDLTVAKRMALLVFTDFACWAPIAFFGLTALLGYPLITVTESKILLVFFYPLNSCANPYLYALLTQQYRRDFFILMGRYGLCKDRAERHKGAIGGKPLPYGSGLQYKRTNVENNIKCNSANNSNRHSVLTTFISVDIPMGRTNSRYSQRSRQGVDHCNSSLDLNLRQINNCDGFEDYLRYTSTENL